VTKKHCVERISKLIKVVLIMGQLQVRLWPWPHTARSDCARFRNFEDLLVESKFFSSGQRHVIKSYIIL